MLSWRQRFVYCCPSACQPRALTTTGRSGRGPDGLGVAKGSRYADEWTPEKNIAWKTPVEGRGHSSPTVWGHYLFITTSIRGGPSGHKAPDHLGYDMKPGYLNPDSEAADHNHALKVLAYDTRTGKLLQPS